MRKKMASGVKTSIYFTKFVPMCALLRELGNIKEGGCIISLLN